MELEQPPVNQPPSGGAPPPVPPPQETPPVVVAPPENLPPPVAPQPKKQVTTRDLSGIRKTEQSRGYKRAMGEQRKRARALGYESVDAMFTAVQEGKKGNPGPQAQPKPQVDDRKMARLLKDKSGWDAERSRLRKRIAHSEKQARFFKRQVTQLTVEADLRVAAVRAGVTDVDYSLQLLRRDMGGKRGKDLDGFEPSKFFAGLKKSHPILFSPQEEPASTGNGSPNVAPPAPPKHTAPPKDTSSEETPKDAREMTRQQFDSHLADMGIRNPGGSRSF